MKNKKEYFNTEYFNKTFDKMIELSEVAFKESDSKRHAIIDTKAFIDRYIEYVKQSTGKRPSNQELDVLYNRSLEGMYVKNTLDCVEKMLSALRKSFDAKELCTIRIDNNND